jgi:hypothetical protein
MTAEGPRLYEGVLSLRIWAHMAKSICCTIMGVMQVTVFIEEIWLIRRLIPAKGCFIGAVLVLFAEGGSL